LLSALENQRGEPENNQKEIERQQRKVWNETRGRGELRPDERFGTLTNRRKRNEKNCGQSTEKYRPRKQSLGMGGKERTKYHYYRIKWKADKMKNTEKFWVKGQRQSRNKRSRMAGRGNGRPAGGSTHSTQHMDQGVSHNKPKSTARKKSENDLTLAIHKVSPLRASKKAEGP